MSDSGTPAANPMGPGPAASPGPASAGGAPGDSNALGAAANPIPGASPDDPTVGLMNHMSSLHNQAGAQYEKLKEATERTGAVREELDKLVKMGDTVTQEDVTKGAVKLVAAGIGAAEIAGLLADMPPDGEALQGWLAAHDLQLRQNEAQLQQITATTRHDLGVSALRLAAAHGMMNPPPAGTSPLGSGPGGAPAAGGSAPPTAGAANDLMGGQANG